MVGTICAGILAGGQSSRFGTDKALALLHGKPLIGHLIDSLRPQVDAVLISVRECSAPYLALDCPLVPDALGAGPLAGVAALLAACRQDWLLLVPCDVWTVPPDWSAHLLRTALQQQARLVVCHDGARLHPTLALLHRELHRSAQQALAAGERALHRWQSSLPGRVVCTVPAPVNINTLADLQLLAANARLGPEGAQH